MDVNRVDQGLARQEKPTKTRQQIDFARVLDQSRTEERVPSPGIRPTESSRLYGSRTRERLEGVLISLGKVTSRNPNVSSLLVKNPVYKKDCWQILHSRVNRDKPYTRIRPGTEVFLNSRTREVLWGKMLQEREAPVAAAEATGPRSPNPHESARGGEQDFPERLIAAVKPLVGRPYGEINCYELLVKGLSNLGVRYEGPGGLGRKLMGMARDQGLSRYAYFNGEGLISASGSPVYTKTVLQVRSPEKEADRFLKEVLPYLERGQIIAFSIHSRGHTGIVSRTDDTWTLINSGAMDNPVKPTRFAKGVGEESLEAEVRGWFELAKARRESLRITLGRLDEQKLLAHLDEAPKKSRKV